MSDLPNEQLIKLINDNLELLEGSAPQTFLLNTPISNDYEKH